MARKNYKLTLLYQCETDLDALEMAGRLAIESSTSCYVEAGETLVAIVTQNGGVIAKKSSESD